VAGRYQPLADDVTIAGDIRPNPSSAVVQKTKRNGLARSPASLRLLGRSARRRPPPSLLLLLSEIVGLCPRFPGYPLATTRQRSDFSMGSRR